MILYCDTCGGHYIPDGPDLCPGCAPADRDELARALFGIRELTIRGRGDPRVAKIACDAVLHIDETPLFEDHSL
jgi:hypothetical protein